MGKKTATAWELRGTGAAGVEVLSRANGAAGIKGLGVPYGAWSDDLGGFREQFAPGAFRDSLARDDVRVLFNHRPDFVLGRRSAGTALFREDSAGVWYEADAPDAGWARDLLASIRRGDIRENSFQFWIERREDQKWEERDGIMWRTVLRARLREMGPQTFPAYPSSSVQLRSPGEVLQEGRGLLHRCAGSSGAGVASIRALEEQDAPTRLRFDLLGIRALEEQDAPTRLRFDLLGLQADPTLRSLALHEAGHAVVGFCFGLGIDRVFLRFDGDGTGRPLQAVGGQYVPRYPCRSDLSDLDPAVVMAGVVAAPETEATHSAGDLGAVPGHLRPEARRSAGYFLGQHWAAVEELAERLMRVGEVDGPHASEILRRHRVQPRRSVA
jgi:uncharacterized protein